MEKYETIEEYKIGVIANLNLDYSYANIWLWNLDSKQNRKNNGISTNEVFNNISVLNSYR